jgi:ferric-dicitrate binding protein FerR (iron transport regulator)
LEQQELYLLITRYLARQTSSEENERLATWVAESADNERTFQQLKALWQHSKAPVAGPETAAALRAVKARLAPAAPQPMLAGWRKTLRRAYLSGGLAVVVLMALVGLWHFRLSSAPEVAYQLYRTAAGQRQTFHLPDGSLVTLAPQSQLRYPANLTGPTREVYLKGEAFFEVSKDARRPFRVHSGTWVTQVLGTKFNVRAFPQASQTAVSLVEGRVRVQDAQDTYLLTPGQELLTDRSTGRIYRQAFDEAKVTGWRTNKLIFKNEKLADVANQIERLYGVKLVFADSATAEVKLWATFDNEPLTAVLEALELAGPITYRREGQVIYLKQQVPAPTQK